MTLDIPRVERRADHRRAEPLSRRVRLAAWRPVLAGDDRKRRTGAASPAA